MRKVIVTAAIVGSTPTKQQNQAVPITPQEIAESAIEAIRKGAAVLHLHVRDPQTGLHTNRLELYQDVVERIREQSDAILNLTTSYGASLIINDDASINTSKTDLLNAEKRVHHVESLKPEMCSLDIGTMNFGPRIFTNVDSIVEKMAGAIQKCGVKPEIELFDLGHIEIAKRLMSNGLIETPPHFQLCMGTFGSMAATAQNAALFANALPQPCTWSIFGVAKSQFDMVAMGVLLGGHVRVGLEDNLYLEKGKKAESNAQLVEKAVDIIRSLNREIASVDEARSILGL